MDSKQSNLTMEKSKIENKNHENKNKKYIKFGDISSYHYDKTVKNTCYCNSDYWCQLCDGDFDLFD